MKAHEPDDSIRLMIALPLRQWFGGNDWENALTIVESLKPHIPHMFLFDCDIYMYGAEREFASHVAAARKFRPNVCLSLPNAIYGMLLGKRDYYNWYSKKKTLWEHLRSFKSPTPQGDIFAGEFGMPLIMLWDHLIMHAPQFSIGSDPVPRSRSRPGCLEMLTRAVNAAQFVHYVPDSGHIEVFERLELCQRGLLQRYTVPAHDVFLNEPVLSHDELITDRVLFAGNLNSSRVMSAFGDDPIVAEVRDYVTSIKCKEWKTAAWYAYEDIASQKAAAGIAELHPDHSFFWSLGRELITNVVTTAFRTTVFKSLGCPIDLYGGFTDPDYVAALNRTGLVRSMGSVPLENLGSIYARYQFSIDITHTPFIRGSNAKVLDCFAAGGFMFVDWKEDLRQVLGEIAEEFMYRSADELNGKMDALRRCPARRKEIIQAVRERVSHDLNLTTLLLDIIRTTAQPGGVG
ncbi:MAG TPA: glycosyltransferase [Methylocella sp.]|nr:glycosyltransferase [Methylocella sp.]